MKAPEKVEFEAALWVVRLERGLTATEQDEFLHWLGADFRHGEALTQQKAGWTRLDLLADWRPMHGARPNRDLLAPPPRGVVSRWRRHAAWFIPGALAAAAAVVLGVFLARPGNPSDATAMAIAPGQIALIERRTLEDGSVIELNRGAELRVNFSAGERHIELSRGEAHFQVAKDPKRPFTVRAGTVTVRAVGTAFNVQRRTASVDVVVTEGTVDVRTPKPAHPGEREATEAARVEAGHRCVVSLATDSLLAVVVVTPADTARLLAWQPTVLDFADAPLSAIIAEFNRRNAPFQITVDDPSLADLPLSASLRSDNVEGFLRLLEGGFGLEVERSGNVISLHRPRRK
jgi:transmembrane sensor